MIGTRITLAFLVALWLAAPSLAYTVYLKDGAKLIAKEPPEIRGSTALIVLQNGTQTSLDASEIDVERTRQANQNDLGSTLILDDGEFTDQTALSEPERERRLTDVTSRRPQQPGAAPSAGRPRTTGPDLDATRGGEADFFATDRTPYRNFDIAAEIQGVFRAQEVDQTKLSQGTRRDRILIDLTTNSEAAVFRGIKVAAAALTHLQAKEPGSVAAFELVLMTSDRAPAGRFLLDVESAARLASGEIEPSAFFVEQVRF